MNENPQDDDVIEEKELDENPRMPDPEEEEDDFRDLSIEREAESLDGYLEYLREMGSSNNY